MYTYTRVDLPTKWLEQLEHQRPLIIIKLLIYIIHNVWRDRKRYLYTNHLANVYLSSSFPPNFPRWLGPLIVIIRASILHSALYSQIRIAKIHEYKYDFCFNIRLESQTCPYVCLPTQFSYLFCNGANNCMVIGVRYKNVRALRYGISPLVIVVIY